MYKPGEDDAHCEQKGKIKIEGITVCVNYSDFLSQTIENNLKHLDSLIVVTDTKDRLTKELCDRYEKVICLQTDVFYKHGQIFNKGEGINAALTIAKKDHWLLHFDSDIWFSPHLKEVLDNRYLDKKAVYGIDRLMCHGWDNWQSYLQNPKAINELYYLVQANAFPIGSRVAHYNQPDGWFPIGYFQLWHPTMSGIIEYPTEWDGADHTDVVFAKSFPRGYRHLIPETYVIHLDSIKGEMGLNWTGRKSSWFGPVEKVEEIIEEKFDEIIFVEHPIIHPRVHENKIMSFLHKYIFKK